ncbi:MAG TPA: rod shape-determining protein MreC, partial [Oscillospiraceae bacterium]|nr:rod shape-determining protein MreC [Oscillospiraceae bacterium]
LLSGKGMCQMVSLPRDSGASAGDLIVTSGIGGVFPKNLVVGTLSEISLSGSGLSLTASVTPAADIASVTDVLVIKSFQGQGEENLSSTTEESSGTESTSEAEESSEVESSSEMEESGTESGAAP